MADSQREALSQYTVKQILEDKSERSRISRRAVVRISSRNGVVDKEQAEEKHRGGADFQDDCLNFWA